MKVYVVMYSDPEGAEFLGVYSTLEKAMARIVSEAATMHMDGEWSATGVRETYEELYAHEVELDADIRLG